MKICKALRKGVVLLVMGMVISFLHADSIHAFYHEETGSYSASEENIPYEVQSFKGEGLPDDQWDDRISLYIPKKKLSGKAITTNSLSGKYGYQSLKYEEQRKAYRILEEAAEAFHYSNMDAVEVSSSGTQGGTKKYIAVAVDMNKSITASKIGEAVVCLIYDHPDYFWTQGYTYYLESADKDAFVTRVTLACHIDYINGSKREKLQEEITQEVEKYMDLIVGLSSDYEKELILHDAIAHKVTYAYDENHNAQQERWAHTIEGIFSEKYYSAVCEGYAKAFQLLLNAAGIENVYVVGKASGQGHAWNQVKIDEEWYNVDLTWNDSKDQKIYRYFNLADDVFGRNHVPFSNEYEVTPKVGEWSYLVNKCISKNYSYENMGEAKENPSCKVGLGKIQGAKVTILNHGVVVTSGSTLTNYNTNLVNGIQRENWATVTTGTALTVKIVPDYMDGESLRIEANLNGEKTYFNGVGGKETSYIITLEEDSVFEVSVYVPVQKVKLNKSKCNITGYGKKVTVTADIIPPTATNPKITWISSKPSVAKVKEGVISTVGAGKATIYAYLENKTVVAKCSVTVKAPYLKIISTKRSVRVGKTLNMKAKLYGAAGGIRWNVSNKKIAAIGAKSGKLKGKKTGTTWVTARKGKIMARVKVTVKK